MKMDGKRRIETINDLHVQQKECWDCGVASSEMVLRALRLRCLYQNSSSSSSSSSNHGNDDNNNNNNDDDIGNGSNDREEWFPHLCAQLWKVRDPVRLRRRIQLSAIREKDESGKHCDVSIGGGDDANNVKDESDNSGQGIGSVWTIDLFLLLWNEIGGFCPLFSSSSSSKTTTSSSSSSSSSSSCSSVNRANPYPLLLSFTTTALGAEESYCDVPFYQTSNYREEQVRVDALFAIARRICALQPQATCDESALPLRSLSLPKRPLMTEIAKQSYSRAQFEGILCSDDVVAMVVLVDASYLSCRKHCRANHVRPLQNRNNNQLRIKSKNANQKSNDDACSSCPCVSPSSAWVQTIERRKASSYQGHYVVLMPQTQCGRLHCQFVHYFDPAHEHRRGCSVLKEEFHRARCAFGTDEDLIVLRHNFPTRDGHDL